MKRTVLYFGGFVVLCSLLGSCVSKKKYEDLLRAKRDADRQIAELQQNKSQLEQDLRHAEEDFNTVRYKLTENNATKDKTIDELYTQLRTLESKQVELKSELSNVSDQIKTNTATSNEQIAALDGA